MIDQIMEAVASYLGHREFSIIGTPPNVRVILTSSEVEQPLSDFGLDDIESLPAIEPEPRHILSSREFLGRFTNAEYDAVRSANNIDLHRAYDSLIAAQFVDLNDLAVGMGLDLMIALGIIDETRKTELMRPA